MVVTLYELTDVHEHFLYFSFERGTRIGVLRTINWQPCVLKATLLYVVFLLMGWHELKLRSVNVFE